MAAQHFKIGVDIDDVLVDAAEHTLLLYNRLHNTGLVYEDWFQTPTVERWGTDDESEMRNRVNSIMIMDELIDTIEPIKDGPRVLRHLVDEGHTLRAVTSRPVNMKPATLRMLDRLYPGIFSDENVDCTDYFGIGGAPKNKLEFAKKHKLTYFIDDLPLHGNLLASNGVKTILFGAYPWNQKGEINPALIRLADWEAVREYFDAESA